jgi:hypothetical protein
VATGMRSPRRQGTPPICPASTVIRSKSFIRQPLLFSQHAPCQTNAPPPHSAQNSPPDAKGRFFKNCFCRTDRTQHRTTTDARETGSDARQPRGSPTPRHFKKYNSAKRTQQPTQNKRIRPLRTRQRTHPRAQLESAHPRLLHYPFMAVLSAARHHHHHHRAISVRRVLA